MYVTAHRVRTSQLQEGINAYLYAHGPGAWSTPPDPQWQPGQLVNTMLMLENMGGNHVRSYLDIVAPDNTWWSQLRPLFIQFVDANRLTPFPWHGIIGQVLFRVGMDQALARTWQYEIAHLYRACETVHHP